MGKLKNEDLTARIYADTSHARKELLSLDQSIKDAKGKLKEMQKQLAKDAAQIIAEIETDAVKKAQGQENKRYAEEQEKYQDNATMLEWIEKRHQAAMAKIRVDGENAWLKRQQEQHELERKRIENSYTEQIVAAKTVGEEAMLKREMAVACAISGWRRCSRAWLSRAGHPAASSLTMQRPMQVAA